MDDWKNPESSEYISGWNGKNWESLRQYISSLLTVGDETTILGIEHTCRCKHCGKEYAAFAWSGPCASTYSRKIVFWLKKQESTLIDYFAKEIFRFALNKELIVAEEVYRYMLNTIPHSISKKLFNPKEKELRMVRI